MKYALAFDLGTGSVKASLFDESGNTVKSSVYEYETRYEGNDIKEQRPEDWWRGVCVSSKNLTGAIDPADICGIALSGHSLGVVAVSVKDGLACEYTPIWSDSRAGKEAEEFFEKTDYRRWYETTGCGFPAGLYSIFKLIWYKKNMPEVYEKTDCFIGSKDYINYKMTGIAATDRSYASGSGVWSLAEHKYSEEYISLSGIDRSKFPEVMLSADRVGELTKEAAEEMGLCPGITVAAGAVDNACMSLGAGCFMENDVYASLGSSAWIAASTSEPLTDFDKKIYTWEHCVPGRYIPSAGIFSSGSSLEWAKRTLFTELLGEENPLYEIDKLAADTPAGANGVIFCPVLSGGSGVDASPDMAGGFSGLRLGTTKGDIARSVLEGVAFELEYALNAISSKVDLSNELLLVGGGSKSKIWRSIYADILGKTVIASPIARDAASLGAAALAFNCAGVWDGYGRVKEIVLGGQSVSPDPENAKIYAGIKPAFDCLCRSEAETEKIINKTR